MSKIIYFSCHFTSDEQHSVHDHRLSADLMTRSLWHADSDLIVIDPLAMLHGDERHRERILDLQCAVVRLCDVLVWEDMHDTISAGMEQEIATARATGIPVVSLSDAIAGRWPS